MTFANQTIQGPYERAQFPLIAPATAASFVRIWATVTESTQVQICYADNDEGLLEIIENYTATYDISEDEDEA